MTAEDRAGFSTAAELFVSLVRRVGPDQWESPGLGAWTIRDLVGHTARSLVTIEAYIGNPSREVEVKGPAEYYRRTLAKSTPSEVAGRGRAAGRALGPEPAKEVAAIAARVLPVVARAPDTLLVTTPAGGMRLVDYLPTRVFELTVHSLDLARALDVWVELPTQAAASSLHVVAHLAQSCDDPGALLLAATGRTQLPAGFTVLGLH
jgi:uncharacterized protein (TIGR03083 family)